MKNPIGDVVAPVIRDTITDCPDVEPYFADVRLLGDVYDLTPFWKLDFWIQLFTQDREELARYRRVMGAVDQCFADLAVLEKAKTGRAPYVPEALVELFKVRFAGAYGFSLGNVIKRAKTAAPLYAAQQMQRFIAEDEWHRRS